MKNILIALIFALTFVVSTQVANASCLKVDFSDKYSIQDNISSSFTSLHSTSINSAGVFVGPIATMCNGYIGLGGFNFNINENKQFSPGLVALTFFNNIIQIGATSTANTKNYSVFVGISATELVKRLK